MQIQLSINIIKWTVEQDKEAQSAQTTAVKDKTNKVFKARVFLRLLVISLHPFNFFFECTHYSRQVEARQFNYVKHL